jgi:hypothetical protein
MIKFLIQRVDGDIAHDFVFTLLESVKYQNWVYNSKYISTRFFNTYPEQKKFEFKPIHRNLVPVGSIEFVSEFIKHFYNRIPAPQNVPKCLFRYANRKIINGTNEDFSGTVLIKSNDIIKAKKENGEDITGMYGDNDYYRPNLPNGNYQISDFIRIDVEYRCFVYRNTLVGIHYYSGDFTIFPNVIIINAMINQYSTSCPIAYTLDIGVNENHTFVIEVHDFFSCGLYGFADHTIYPQMLYKWFKEYTKNIK